MNFIKRSFSHLFERFIDLKLVLMYCKIYISSLTQSHRNCNVLIDMKNLRMNRRVAQIVLQLTNSGYSPCLKITLVDFVKKRLMQGECNEIAFEKAQLYTIKHKRDSFVFSICNETQKDKYNKALIINDNIFSFPSHTDEQFFYPILKHPKRMLKESTNKESDFSRAEKKIGLLFIGNTEESYNYSSEVFHTKFNLHTRKELLDYIISSFPDFVYRPNDINELLTAIEKNMLQNKIVIIDKFFVHEQYMYLYSISWFHLWTVGAVQPYCHNQIESMSCGTIPVYEKYSYYPGLKNGFNCLNYADFNELNDILDSIISKKFSDNDLKTMKQNIEELYNLHYSNSAIKKSFDDFVNNRDVFYQHFYVCPSATYNQ